MRPHSRSRTLACLIVFLLLFSNAPTRGQTTDYKGLGVIQAQGAVTLNGTLAATGATIYPGDSIRTGADGYALVNLPYRGSVVIAANSDLTFLPVSLGSHFMALHRGKFALRFRPEGSGTATEFGKFVFIPLIGQGVEFDVEIAADGSAKIRCLNGSVGIMESQGANSGLFLKSGEAAEIAANGVVEFITPPVTPPSSAPSAAKSHTGWIILGTGVAGVAALVAVLVSKHKTSPVSPSIP
jgi:hypothetical protein